MTANPRAARAVRGVFAGTLCLEALTVLFVPRAIAQTGSGLTTSRLVLLLVLAGLLILTAGLLRFPAALVAGSVLQVALVGCGIIVSAMYVLGVIFVGIWIYELRVRAQLLR